MNKSVKKRRLPMPRLTARLALMIGGLFLSFSVLVVLLFYTTNQSLMRRHYEKSLLRDAYHITRNLMAEHVPENAKELYESFSDGENPHNLLLFEQLSGADIWVIDTEHCIYTYQNESLNIIPGGTLPAFAEQTAFEAFMGQSVCRAGYIEEEEVLVSGAPVTNSDGDVIAAVLLCASVESMSRGTGQSLNVLIGSLAAALAVILIATILFARSFIRPVMGIKTTALRLAAGDYEVRTNIRRTDEIGELSDAMNTLAVRLEEARARQQQEESARQDFLSRISHELKTPVTVIRGLLETWEDGLADTEEEQTAYRRQMLTESIRLQKLITSLLDLTRLQTMDYTFPVETVDMTELLGDVLMSARILASAHQIDVVCDPPAAACLIQGNYDRLRQLLMILIDNAVKYSPDHTQITLELDTQRQCLLVRDQGRGIAPERLTHIFDPYYRGENSDRDGTGLGLAIASEIARRHGFSLQAGSEPGTGSTFSLLFCHNIDIL